MPAESQKLVAKGKVLDDPKKTLNDYKLGEGSFIVVMKEKVSVHIFNRTWLINHTNFHLAKTCSSKQTKRRSQARRRRPET